MNNQLAILISDYQASVAAAVDMMQRSGIPRPMTNTDWVFNDITHAGNWKALNMKAAVF
ncbi:hypothetical protein NLO88_23750 [Pseudomonas syringae]|nr:hypothetical protein [Pseudomonas syringae]